MRWISRHQQGVWRGVAVLLLLSGFFCGYWWFYKLAPARRTLSPEWNTSHSEREYWREIQKGIDRGLWFCDYGYTVGRCGDKVWAEWIMAHVKPEMSMSSCMGSGLAHSATAMRLITNQDAGKNAEDWLRWWEKNKSKSQIEWISDGFRQHGLSVKIPPSPDQIPSFLELIGKPKTLGQSRADKHLRYNAFRCLRDSGFEPVAYALANRTVSPEVERGLLEYVQMKRPWPQASDVGVLPIGGKDASMEPRPLPFMLETRFQIAANAIVFGQILLGLAALLRSYKSKA